MLPTRCAAVHLPLLFLPSNDATGDKESGSGKEEWKDSQSLIACSKQGNDVADVGIKIRVYNIYV